MRMAPARIRSFTRLTARQVFALAKVILILLLLVAPRFDLGLILNCGVALFVPCDWAIRGDSLLVKSPRRVEGPPF